MKKTRGFTLVEMLVALTLFSVITLIATGSVLKVSDAHRKAQGIETVINNLNFALETVSREIRGSRTYHCATINQVSDWTSIWNAYSSDAGGNDCFVGDDTSGNALAYLTGANTPLGFMLSVTNGIGSLMACAPNGGSTVCSRLTSPNLDIETLKFYVDGVEPGSLNQQPVVVMSIKGIVKLGRQGSTEFTVQTTMVQRSLDL